MCNRPLIGALINQTNIYFPRTISAILLPDLQQQDQSITQIRNEIEQDPGACGIARTLWNMNNRSGAVALVQDSLRQRGLTREPSSIERALESLLTPTSVLNQAAALPSLAELDLLAFRRAEFECYS